MHSASLCDPAAVQCLPSGLDRIDADLGSTAAGNGEGTAHVNVAVLDPGNGLPPSSPRSSK
ncbi:MAG TPA: hypothetical protein VK915_12140 [Gaiellaceae bacterium]|nr:hypothetical protein [Gaiellaceae bacterium]